MTPRPPGTPPPAAALPSSGTTVALQHYRQALDALRKGDWQTFGVEMDALQKALEGATAAPPSWSVVRVEGRLQIEKLLAYTSTGVEQAMDFLTRVHLSVILLLNRTTQHWRTRRSVRCAHVCPACRSVSYAWRTLRLLAVDDSALQWSPSWQSYMRGPACTP